MTDEQNEAPKRKYSANGLAREGAMRFLMGQEMKQAGTAGYPWPADLKTAMVDALDGAISEADMVARVDALAGPHLEAANKALKEARKNG